MVGHAHLFPGRPSGIEDPLSIVMGTLYCRSQPSVSGKFCSGAHTHQPESVCLLSIFSGAELSF